MYEHYHRPSWLRRQKIPKKPHTFTFIAEMRDVILVLAALFCVFALFYTAGMQEGLRSANLEKFRLLLNSQPVNDAQPQTWRN